MSIQEGFQEHPIVLDLLSQVEESMAELLDGLREAAAGSVQAEDVLLLAKTEGGRADLRACLFDLMRAFATCAYDLDFRDSQSHVRLLDVWERRPELRWVSDIYRQNVTLESINPELLTDAAARSKAVARLEEWLNPV